MFNFQKVYAKMTDYIIKKTPSFLIVMLMHNCHDYVPVKLTDEEFF